MASALNFALVISATDKASGALRTVAKAFDAVSAAGAKLRVVGEHARVARENVDNFTGRLKDGLASVLAPSHEVETAMARLAVQVSASGGDITGTLASVRASALAWQSAHVQSASTFLEVTQAMIVTGLKSGDAIKATEAALRASTATGAEAAGIAATLGVAYRQMGDRTKDAGTEFARFGDILTRAQQTFRGIKVGDLLDPMKDALPAAKAAKIEFEQVVAVLGTLNAAGIQGGEAGAGFAAVLEKLNDASKALGFTIEKTSTGGVDLVKTLAGLEKKVGGLDKMTPEMTKKLQDAFGPAAFKGIAAVLGQTGELTTSLGALKNSAGAAAAATATLEGTTGAQFQIAQQQLDAVKVELATSLTPAILAMVPHIRAAVDAFAGFARENPQLVSLAGSLGVIAVVAGTVGAPIISTIGAVASLSGTLITAGASAISFAASFIASVIPALVAGAASAWAFAAAMLANPITWIVLAIVALAAVIYIYWEPISGFFRKLWASVKDYFIAAWDILKGVWSKVVGFFGGIWDEIRGAFQESFVGGVLTVLKYLSPITWIVKAFGLILPYLSRLTVAMGDALIAGLKALPGLLLEGGKWLLEALVTGYAWLQQASIAFWAGVWSAFKAGVAMVIDGTVKYFKFLWSVLTGIADSIVAALKSAWAFFGNGIKNDLGRVGALISGIWDTIRSAVDGGILGVLGLLASFNPIVLIAKGFNAVTEWLTGYSLADAGGNIVRTIAQGISAAASAPVEAMQGIVQKVRNLLPFSPAKEGPLKDLHKVKLVETVADGVKPAPLVDAMTGVAGQAMAAVASPAVPTASIPASVQAPAALDRAGQGGAGSGPTQVSLSITVQGDQPIADQLDAYWRDPAKVDAALAAIQRAQARAGRRELA